MKQTSKWSTHIMHPILQVLTATFDEEAKKLTCPPEQPSQDISLVDEFYATSFPTPEKVEQLFQELNYFPSCVTKIILEYFDGKIYTFPGKSCSGYTPDYRTSQDIKNSREKYWIDKSGKAWLRHGIYEYNSPFSREFYREVYISGIRHGPAEHGTISWLDEKKIVNQYRFYRPTRPEEELYHDYYDCYSPPKSAPNPSARGGSHRVMELCTTITYHSHSVEFECSSQTDKHLCHGYGCDFAQIHWPVVK